MVPYARRYAKIIHSGPLHMKPVRRPQLNLDIMAMIRCGCCNLML